MSAIELGSQNTLDTPHSRPMHTPDSQSVVLPALEARGGGLKNASVGGGREEGLGGECGGEVGGRREGGGGGGQGMVEEKERDCLKVFPQVEQTPDADNQQFSSQSADSMRQSGRRKRQSLDALSQAGTLVRTSQDPHSPIWIEGQSYPAQYLVRQTRSMSHKQADKETPLVEDVTSVQKGKTRARAHVGMETQEIKASSPAEVSVSKGEDCREAKLAEVTSGCCNPHAHTVMEYDRGKVQGEVELYVSNSTQQSFEVEKSTSLLPGESGSYFSLPVSIPIAHRSPRLRVSCDIPRLGPFLAFPRPPSPQLIPHLSTDFFLPDRGFLSLKLEKLRTAGGTRKEVGKKSKGVELCKPQLDKPAGSFLPALISGGDKETTVPHDKSKCCLGNKVVSTCQDACAGSPLVCKYTRLHNSAAMEEIELKCRSRLQLSDTALEVRTYVYKYNPSRYSIS